MEAFAVRFDDDGAARIGWGEQDWLGPIRSHVSDPSVRASVIAQADRPLAILRLSVKPS